LRPTELVDPGFFGNPKALHLFPLDHHGETLGQTQALAHHPKGSRLLRQKPAQKVPDEDGKIREKREVRAAEIRGEEGPTAVGAIPQGQKGEVARPKDPVRSLGKRAFPYFSHPELRKGDVV